MVRIGIDLGGTKIEAVALVDDQEVYRKRLPTPRKDYDGTIATVAKLVREFELMLGVTASVGVGHPGSLSPTTGLIRNANSTALNGRPLDRDLSAALGGRALRLANDANCFAMSEAIDGAAAGLGCVFGVILGTGVGGGLVVNDRPLMGRNAIAGEWGHNPLPRMRDGERPGPPCYCGRRGCIETWLSGRGLVDDHRWFANVEAPPFNDAGSIVEAAAAGDEACLRSVERYAHRLARALAVVINIVDPDAIVLGGGLSNCAMLYERVPQLWVEHVFSDRVSTPLLRPKWGDSSGVRGAARLWP